MGGRETDGYPNNMLFYIYIHIYQIGLKILTFMKFNLYNSPGAASWTFKRIGFMRRRVVLYKSIDSRTLLINIT